MIMIQTKDLVEVLNQTQPRSYVHVVHEKTGLEAKCNFFKDRNRNKAMCIAMIESAIYVLKLKNKQNFDDKEFYIKCVEKAD